MMVLDHLPKKLLTPITFAHRFQLRCTLVYWNPLSIANKSHLRPCNLIIVSILSTSSDGFSNIYLNKHHIVYSTHPEQDMGYSYHQIVCSLVDQRVSTSPDMKANLYVATLVAKVPPRF